MNTVQILLDMDGVLSNFVKGACEAHGKPYEPEKLTQFDMAAHWGITVQKFWEPLQDKSFWEGLEPYPWAEDLLSKLRAIAPVTICTAPSQSHDCGAGKLSWLERELSISSRDVVLCNKKWLLARPRHILIDDSPRKADDFARHGGIAVLFPQPWNDKRSLAGDDRWKVAVKSAEKWARSCND
jgi:5'(3')-deoxyribonucleotidase